MKSFDEWKEEQERIHNDYDAENAWCAGQQSKQAEVDELRSQRDVLSNKVDELQKQIDEAIELLEYNEYVDSPLQALNILKGACDD